MTTAPQRTQRYTVDRTAASRAATLRANNRANLWVVWFALAGAAWLVAMLFAG